MKRFRALAVVLVALVCAVAVSVALAAGSGGAVHKKPHAKAQATAPAHKANHARHVAAKSSGEPTDPTSPGETAGAPETDGVDAGGDHQCPPDCAPGELP